MNKLLNMLKGTKVDMQVKPMLYLTTVVDLTMS